MNRVALGITSVIILLLFVYYLTESGYFISHNGRNKLEVFAQCLSDKGIVMYGSKYCSHCENQKALFGDAFKYINYVECTENKQTCIEKGIMYVPAWIINGEKYTGEMSLERLSELSGCEL
ncbi:MAG: glutaredoxin family protein [Candidatus Heimdallarchaeaceae archaeon]